MNNIDAKIVLINKVYIHVKYIPLYYEKKNY